MSSHRLGPFLSFSLLFVFSLGSLSKASPVEQLAEATRLFQQANDAALKDPAAARELYRSAARRFSHLTTEEGIENPELLTNEGNASLLGGDLGGAVFAYRRAARLPSAPQEIQFSLQHARDQTIDRFEASIESPPARLWSSLLSLPWGFWGTLFVFSWAAVWWLLFRLTTSPEKERNAWLWKAGLALGIALPTLLILLAQGARRDAPFGVLTAETTIARKGDGLIYDPAFTSPLHPGLEFSPVDRRRGWIHAQFPDGTQAWIEEGNARLWPELAAR